MKKLLGKRFLAVAIAFVMIAALAVPAIANGLDGGAAKANRSVTVKQIDAAAKLGRINKAELPAEEAKHSDSDIVRVSIVLPGKSLLDAGYSVKGMASDTSAISYRNSLKQLQDKLADKISKTVLGGEELDVQWNITLAANIISANVPYGKIEAIKNILGVADVVLETEYQPEETEESEADHPDMATSVQMTKGVLAWAAGYTGAGSKIAIVDTGLDVEHISFDAEAFEYALKELNDERAEEGKAPIVIMTEDDVFDVWDDLNIAQYVTGPEGVYINSKVPFAVNYVDRDLQVTHENDRQGEHGSHVAGIAAANRYIKDGDEFVEALSTVEVQGEAPDAQLMVMKVFGKGGGAYDSDYMVAIEDAIMMGADAVNLSLGSAAPGQTINTTYAKILNEISESDTVVTMSAGNNFAWQTYGLGNLYEDDIN